MTAAKSSLTSSLLAAQKAMPAIQRDSINPHFRNKYVSLDSLIPPVLAALNEHGLVLSQFPTTLENGGNPRPALRTRLTHADTGEYVEDTMLLMAAKDDPQGQGSALTYARRYALMAILGLVADEDDDGARASQARRGNQTGTPQASEPGPVVDEKAAMPAESPASPSAAAQLLPTGKRATEAQTKKLRALADELVKAKLLTTEALDSASQKIVGRDFADAVDGIFTMAEASGLIGRLENLKKNGAKK